MSTPLSTIQASEPQNPSSMTPVASVSRVGDVAKEAEAEGASPTPTTSMIEASELNNQGLSLHPESKVRPTFSSGELAGFAALPPPRLQHDSSGPTELADDTTLAIESPFEHSPSLPRTWPREASISEQRFDFDVASGKQRGDYEAEATTSAGLKIRRRDTWICGYGWNRHVRVIEGLGYAEIKQPSKEDGMAAAIERAGTW